MVRNFDFSEAASLDVAIGTLLPICQREADGNKYPKLISAYWLALKRNAYKLVDPKRRYKREVPSSALGSTFVDCVEPADFIETCPSPWASQEERVAASEEIEMSGWCKLNQLQQAVVLKKAVLGMADSAIAEEHSGMRPSQAKDIYQNTMRKLRQHHESACR